MALKYQIQAFQVFRGKTAQRVKVFAVLVTTVGFRTHVKMGRQRTVKLSLQYTDYIMTLITSSTVMLSNIVLIEQLRA